MATATYDPSKVRFCVGEATLRLTPKQAAMLGLPPKLRAFAVQNEDEGSIVVAETASEAVSLACPDKAPDEVEAAALPDSLPLSFSAEGEEPKHYRAGDFAAYGVRGVILHGIGDLSPLIEAARVARL